MFNKIIKKNNVCTSIIPYTFIYANKLNIVMYNYVQQYVVCQEENFTVQLNYCVAMYLRAMRKTYVFRGKV